MIAAAVDTHALIWYLSGDQRLSESARQFLSAIGGEGNQVVVSSISLVEIAYLAEKGRLTAEWPATVFGLFDNVDTIFVEAPVDLEIAKSLTSLANSGIADMPDRIIAATSTFFSVPLITKDRIITNSSVETLW